MIDKSFYGKKYHRCRKHRFKYIFFCLKCFDPQWETPIPLRLSPVKYPVAASYGEEP
jgi:hypothetical protein